MPRRLASVVPVVRAVRRAGLWREASLRGAAAYLRDRMAGAVGASTIYRVQAAARPDRIALIEGDVRFTFAELEDRIELLSMAFSRDLELHSKDAALLVMRNRREMIEAQAALARIGVSTVPVSWRSKAPELAYVARHAGAKLVIADESSVDELVKADHEPEAHRFLARVIVGRSHEGFLDYESLLVSAKSGRRVDVPRASGDVVVYTSGTTGKPKGAVRGYDLQTGLAILQFIGETPLCTEDRHLVVCPLYHSTAFAFVGMTFLLGSTVVVSEGFEAERFLATVERERITTTAVVPTMLHRLLELAAPTREKYDTSSLRAVMCGGSALSGLLARRFIEAFGPVLYNFYGATETGINTVANSQELLASPGTIGHLVPGNEIRVLDDAGNPVAIGETGELWVRNGLLVRGYHRDTDATSASLRDGFFSVGDLAHEDARGLYHIDGRKKDMIISGGVNVYPAEVEECLHAHPAVAEAAVVGVADDEWGERVRAFVVPRAGAAVDEAEIIAHCRARLAGPKAPREVVFVDMLPRNPTGKVLKRALREHVR